MLNKSLALIVLLALAASTGFAQRKMYGTDMQGPFLMQRGTSLPSTCTVGAVFFDSDATAGQNLYACTATNTWTLQSGAGVCGTNGYLNFNDAGACGATSMLWDPVLGTLTVPGGIIVPAGPASQKATFAEGTGNGSNTVSLGSPEAVTTSYRLDLPPVPPTSGQTLLSGTCASARCESTWGTPSSGGPRVVEHLAAISQAGAAASGFSMVSTANAYPTATAVTGSNAVGGVVGSPGTELEFAL